MIVFVSNYYFSITIDLMKIDKLTPETEILGELGYSGDAIAELRESGVV